MKVFLNVLDIIKKVILIIMTIIITIVLSVLFLALAYQLFLALRELTSKNPQTASTIIAALFAFISIPIGKYFEHKYSIKAKDIEKKTILYTDLLNCLIDNFYIKLPEVIREEGFSKQYEAVFSEFNKKILICASDDVLNMWYRIIKMFEKIDSESDLDKRLDFVKQKLYPEIEDMIKQIRLEIKLKGIGIKKEKITLLFNKTNNK